MQTNFCVFKDLFSKMMCWVLLLSLLFAFQPPHHSEHLLRDGNSAENVMWENSKTSDGGGKLSHKCQKTLSKKIGNFQKWIKGDLFPRFQLYTFGGLVLGGFVLIHQQDFLIFCSNCRAQLKSLSSLRLFWVFSVYMSMHEILYPQQTIFTFLHSQQGWMIFLTSSDVVHVIFSPTCKALNFHHKNWSGVLAITPLRGPFFRVCGFVF